MIAVQVSINNRTTVVSTSAVRTYPKSKKPREGTMCTYKMRIYNQNVGTMKHAFEDCGIGLAKAMLDYFGTFTKEEVETFKTMALYDAIAKEAK